MKTFLKFLGGLVGLVVVLGLCGFVWASSKARSAMARTVAVHAVDFPIPFPLPDSEIARLKITPDSAARVAQARATERGRHLVEARYGCGECHGANFGGGTMIDAAIIGRLLGPNLTLGKGSRTVKFVAADWDHIVRHGIRGDGTAAAMPSADFEGMTDQELSDIVTYIRSKPPVDSTVPPVTLGPLGKFLVATGKLPLSVDLIKNHNGTHIAYPPPMVVNIALGEHIARTCAGCHGPTFAGGPIPGGDPSWPPAKNLTPHQDAIGKWTMEQFKTTLRTGKRPDGSELRAPMNGFVSFAQKMSDVELDALWTYLHSLPAVAPATAK